MTASLLGLVAGTAMQLQMPLLPEAPWCWLYLALALVVYGVVATKNIAIEWLGGFGHAVIAFVAAAAVGLSLTCVRATLFDADSLAPELEGRDILVTGVVSAMPQRSEAGLRFRLDLDSAEAGGRPARLPPRLYVSWYNSPVATSANAADLFELQRQPATLTAGERWQMTVRLKAPHGGSNPHGFDFELWLWEQGLQAAGYVRAGPRDTQPRRLAATWWHPIEQARQAVRDRIANTVTHAQSAGVIAALVTGDQNAIERADWDVFRATGVAHLMSISGLHVTMFAWAAAAALGWLWRRSERLCLAVPAQHAALVGGVALAAAYALFSGWGVPSQRTVLMLATVGLLRLSGKRWPWPQVWLLACAVVVLADPWALLQAGFWLSFVAVGVLFATDSGADYADSTRANGHFDQSNPLKKLWRALAGLFREQWVITLALAPLTLLLFGQVSLVGLVANALAIPWVTLVVTPLAMAGVFVAPLWALAAWAVQMLQGVLQVMAGWPWATYSAAQAPLWAGAAGVLGGVLLAMRLPLSLRLLALPLLLPVVLWQAPRPAPGHFELLAADIGQGNAVLVRTAAHTLVYDAGPRFSRESDAGQRVLVPLLRALDDKVDTLVLSHRDADHTGGALAVLGMQTKARLLSSIEPEHDIQAVRPATRCEAGQHWRWDGVDFDVLHPRAEDYAQSAKSNALSCVLKVSNGRHSALLVGDIEKEQERRLAMDEGDASGAATRPSLAATVLLVPHHGSKTSSSDAFLDAVKPKIGLIQSGYRNRFGHPADDVVERYEARGIALYDSPHCGAATWRSTEPEAVRCEREVNRRYWHHRVP